MTSLKKAREIAHSLGYGIVKGRTTTFPWDVVLPNGTKHESRSIQMCIEIIHNNWRRANKPTCHRGIVDAYIEQFKRK